MKRIPLIAIIVSLLGSTGVPAQNQKDDLAIEQAIMNGYTGWVNKDVALATQDYADDTDWTNAFGDRVQSKEDLETLLTEIFSLDFVMAGKSENRFNDIDYLSPDIAVARSKTVRVGQKWGDNTAMDDRHINHLRVFHKKNDQWKIVSHMISQAWTKK